MRRLPLLLLFALPLLAQERDAQQPPPAADTPQLDALLRRILKAAPEHRASLLEKLRARLALARAGTRGKSSLAITGIHSGPVVFVGGDSGARESMTGTWQEDGRRGSYTLRSVGGGRYELKVVTEGRGEPIADKGSFAELMRKYPFLANRRYILLAPVPTPATPAIGCRVSPASEALRYHLALPQGAGLLVEEVSPGSRAAQLGLKRFDVLVRLDGEPIDDPAQLEALRRGKGRLEFVRRGKTRILELPGESAAATPPGR